MKAAPKVSFGDYHWHVTRRSKFDSSRRKRQQKRQKISKSSSVTFVTNATATLEASKSTKLHSTNRSETLNVTYAKKSSQRNALWSDMWSRFTRTYDIMRVTRARPISAARPNYAGRSWLKPQRCLQQLITSSHHTTPPKCISFDTTTRSRSHPLR